MNNAFKELFCERAKKDGIKTERERGASYFEQVRSSKRAEKIAYHIGSQNLSGYKYCRRHSDKEAS